MRDTQPTKGAEQIELEWLERRGEMVEKKIGRRGSKGTS
jgi:hypothetical protein